MMESLDICINLSMLENQVRFLLILARSVMFAECVSVMGNSCETQLDVFLLQNCAASTCDANSRRNTSGAWPLIHCRASWNQQSYYYSVLLGTRTNVQRCLDSSHVQPDGKKKDVGFPLISSPSRIEIKISPSPTSGCAIFFFISLLISHSIQGPFSSSTCDTVQENLHVANWAFELYS